ncbi:MAG: TrkA family potassium uptake protein [Deinococcus sp.]|nr:TrkA family potassium uptake protein [Deinococcus sp.]
MRQFAVLGLGRFGSAVATELYRLGHEVIAIDSDEERVNAVARQVTHPVIADAAHRDDLLSAGVANCDVAVVAFGANMEGNILATLLLKELGIKTVVAKAQNQLHEKVLKRIGADRVVRPEYDMGKNLAQSLSDPDVLLTLPVAENFSVVEIRANEKVSGEVRELNLNNRFGLSIVVVISAKGEVKGVPRADTVLRADDVLVIAGFNQAIAEFRRFLES